MQQKKVIIYDASLLVDAYETQLFRTGLYRVCSELLTRLIQSGDYEIWLYDVFGRERLLRQYIVPQWHDVRVLGTHVAAFQRVAYPLLKQADLWRKQQRSHNVLCKWGKNGCVYLSRLLHKFLKDKSLRLPHGVSCYISTYYPVPRWVHQQGIQATLIVHDLIPLIHPEWFPSEANKQLLNEIIHSVNQYDSVVCVSHATRSDFLRFRPDFPPERVHVAHLASFIQKRNSSKACLPSYANQPYLLSVCTLEPRKNLITVLRAYEHLLLQDRDAAPNLILVGAMGWKTGELVATICRLQTEYPNKIHLTGYIPDEQLLLLYEHARLFLYLSLYEGFGLPPLEAMSCGCPVVTSNVSSLPEVVGGAGWTVEPTDVQALVKAIEQVFDIDSAILRSRSLNRAQQFSWKQFANKIIETLK